jgi:TolB-like protein
MTEEKKEARTESPARQVAKTPERSISAAISEMTFLDKTRIAVLPFLNMSRDEENEYFSDGMTEELISKLSKIASLKVIARTSVMTYKGKGKKIDEIGWELRVGTILEGSVRKAGDKLRIAIQLIDVQSQEHLWSQDYARELKDVFAIQSDVAQNVAEALKVQLLAGEKQRIEKKGTESLEAYNLYLKSRYYWDKRNKETLKKGIEYFEQAIEKDPNYAQAYVGLADSYSISGAYGFLPSKEVFPKAKVAAMKALERDDTLAEAHASLGYARYYDDWDWSEAEKEFKRALELNPNSAISHYWYSTYLSAMVRLDEGIAEAKRAQELDPLSLVVNASVGWSFWAARQYDQAIEQFQKALEIDQNYFDAYNGLGLSYIEKGMYEEAITAAQKAINSSRGHPGTVGFLGYIYGMSGKKVEAQKLIDGLKERSKEEYVSPLAFAWIYIGLGEKDQAFEWLQKAYEARSPFLIRIKVVPFYDSLRSDPRFTELLKKVGLEK